MIKFFDLDILPFMARPKLKLWTPIVTWTPKLKLWIPIVTWTPIVTWSPKLQLWATLGVQSFSFGLHLESKASALGYIDFDEEDKKKLMQPEKLFELLLAYLCEREDKTTEISKSNADWETLLRLSIPHGVAPLFYHRLINDAGTQVPKGVLDSLCDAYHSNVFKNAQYYQQLSEVLKRFIGPFSTSPSKSWLIRYGNRHGHLR